MLQYLLMTALMPAKLAVLNHTLICPVQLFYIAYRVVSK